MLFFIQPIHQNCSLNLKVLWPIYAHPSTLFPKPFIVSSFIKKIPIWLKYTFRICVICIFFNVTPTSNLVIIEYSSYTSVKFINIYCLQTLIKLVNLFLLGLFLHGFRTFGFVSFWSQIIFWFIIPSGPRTLGYVSFWSSNYFSSSFDLELFFCIALILMSTDNKSGKLTCCSHLSEEALNVMCHDHVVY